MCNVYQADARYAGKMVAMLTTTYVEDECLHQVDGAR